MGILGTVAQRRMAPLNVDWPPFLVLFFCETAFFRLRNIHTSDRFMMQILL